MKKVGLLDIAPGYDIVVVGAGPAGCIVARDLSKNFTVLLIDSKSLPRYKTCGGVLTKESIEFLEPLHPPEKIFVKQKVVDIEYYDFSNDKKFVAEKGFWNVDRGKFDHWILSLLDDKKGTIVEKTSLIDFNLVQGRDLVSLVLESNGFVKTIIAKYLIGCDGAFSFVRKKISNKKIPYYVGVQELVEVEKNLNNVLFILDKEITDSYGWLIPKNNSLLIGVGLPPYDATKKFELFKEKISKKYGIKFNGKISAGIALAPARVDNIYLGNGNILLVGEAAGLISPTSSEGISFALRSGKYCAEAINSNPKKPITVYTKKCVELIHGIKKKFERNY